MNRQNQIPGNRRRLGDLERLVNTLNELGIMHSQSVETSAFGPQEVLRINNTTIRFVFGSDGRDLDWVEA